MYCRPLTRLLAPSLACISILSAGVLQAQREIGTLTANPNLQAMHDLGTIHGATPVTIDVHLKQPNEKSLVSAVDALYDPKSPSFHKWMTDADLQKFAPSSAQIDLVSRELEHHGLKVVSIDPTGLSLRAVGSAAALQSAFQTPVHQFEHNGTIFRTNTQAARLTGEAGNFVDSVSGLESHVAHPMFVQGKNLMTGKAPAPLAVKNLTPAQLAAKITDICLSAPQTLTLQTPGTTTPTAVFTGSVYLADFTKSCNFTAAQLQKVYGLDQAYAAGLDGTGQTIVLIEAYGYDYMLPDANAFSTLMGLPLLNATNFKVVYPDGKPNVAAGVRLGWDAEIALDIQWAHAMAPGAKIAVVAAGGQDSQDFQHAISYAASHHLGNSFSNSWEIGSDFYSGPAEQNAFDRVITLAAARGISVNFSTGDGGDHGIVGQGAGGVPSTSPRATAVGGTTILNKVGASGFDHLGWGTDATTFLFGTLNDPPNGPRFIGGAGGGESLYFAKPRWQDALPGTGRQTPDVSALASSLTGVPLVLTSNPTVGQQVLTSVGGTSLACPIFSAIWAIANQKAGHPLGHASPILARLSSGLLDVQPIADTTNVTGTITDANGTTAYTSDDLFGTAGAQRGFRTALFGNGFIAELGIAFDLDTSLTTAQGWDNVTGFGTPIGMDFLNAVTK